MWRDRPARRLCPARQRGEATAPPRHRLLVRPVDSMPAHTLTGRNPKLQPVAFDCSLHRKWACFNRMMVGIDIGGTKIELAAFDAGFATLGVWRESTPRTSYGDLVNRICTLVKRAHALAGPTDSIGVGVPGLMHNGRVTATSNIPGLKGKNLRRDLSAAVGQDVILARDVDAFVQSEAHDGSGCGFSSVCGLVLGTGYSGAFSFSGSSNPSWQGAAGEIGHVPISARVARRHELPLRKCGCGLTGCIEQYVSGPGLEWMCRHLGAPYRSCIELAEGLGDRSGPAERVLDVYLDCLGSSIASLILSNDPDVFVLGGGVSNITSLYERLPDRVETHLFGNLTSPPIKMARHGDSSGVRGAALIARQQQLDEPTQ